MKKIALFLNGEPNLGENQIRFYKNINRDLGIMKSLAEEAGYSVKVIGENNLNKELKSTYGNKETLIYYTGHGKENVFGNNEVSSFLERLSRVSGKKTIIFDSCSGNNFGETNLPKNSIILGAKQLSMNGSIAMMLWDYVRARKNEFSSINKSAFDNMKHNNIYCLSNC